MVRVPLRHHDALVTQQLLHLVKVLTGLYEPRREGVPQVVKMEILDFRLDHGGFEGLPHASYR
jgi:hypothetical protein